jgi:hypothetical protein
MTIIRHPKPSGIVPTVLLSVIIFCLLLDGTGYAQRKTNQDEPGRKDESSGPRETPRYQDFPESELGRQLSDHLNYLAGVGKDAEQKYQESLKRLRERAPEVVRMIAEAYPKIQVDRYFRRWSIVETMREMRNNDALKSLQGIAFSPIPAERWADSERFSKDKEISIRVTAVGGLSELARQGNTIAEQSLLRLITNKELGIRRQAIRGYLGAGQDLERRIKVLKSKVPKSDYGLITLDATDVKRVPHPDDVPDNLKPRYRQKDDDAPKAVTSRNSFGTTDKLFQKVSRTEPKMSMSHASPNPDTCFWMPGDNNESGDNFYGAFTCDQVYVDQFWDHFDFDQGDWDDGFGYEAPCDLARPLARTFNALYLLAYSAEDYATSTGDFSGNALRWAYPYAATYIDELDGRCGSGSATSGARATTYSGAFVDDRTVLKWPFFYGEVVVERAGTVLHESRHAAGKGHNGGSRCPRTKSCDTNWAYKGANMYQVLYLWWFYVDGTRTTTGMRNFAQQEGQRIIDRGFVTNPGYVI